MFPTATSILEEAANVCCTSSSGARVVQHDEDLHHQQPHKIKKKRSLPGNPDPDAEVIALSPKTLVATNRYVCEICHKGFQREQNLQLHRRGHNLPWKLKQRINNKEAQAQALVVVKKKAYVCPEPSCVHHNPSRALGDLTGIKKHYCRKHGEKKWKCDKCSKLYAVQSDCKAHSKTCGTKQYTCDCGSIFSRKDSFITHRAFCDALAEETERLSATQIAAATAAAANPLLLHSLFLLPTNQQNFQNHHITTTNYFRPWNSSSLSHENPNPNPSIIINNNNNNNSFHVIKPEPQTLFHDPTFSSSPLTLLQQLQSHNASRRLHVASSNAATSATALLQMAATVGAISTTTTGPAAGSSSEPSRVTRLSGMGQFGRASQQLDSVITGTRDFLGLKMVDSANVNGGVVDVSMDVKDMLTFAGGSVEYQQPQRFGFIGTNSSNAPHT